MHKRKITTSAEIGRKIKERRRKLKISQEELAEMLGVTYQQIQRYENGTNKLNVENIQVVANALSVSLIYFFETYNVPAITEEQLHKISSIESKLLRRFKKIKNGGSKNVVIQVAKLAAKATI